MRKSKSSKTAASRRASRKKSGGVPKAAKASRKKSGAATTSLAVREGEAAPDFRLPSNEGREISLSDYRGKKVVLYFYPKDFTPGCTKEACSFRDGMSEIQAKGAVVLGVSADTPEVHQKFSSTHGLSFPLLSDTKKEVLQRYGVWQKKSLYGRTFMGIVRSTVIIDEHGIIKKIFPRVSVDGHLDEVLSAL